jgi:hypothetical protein
MAPGHKIKESEGTGQFLCNKNGIRVYISLPKILESQFKQKEVKCIFYVAAFQLPKEPFTVNC